MGLANLVEMNRNEASLGLISYIWEHWDWSQSMIPVVLLLLPEVRGQHPKHSLWEL